MRDLQFLPDRGAGMRHLGRVAMLLLYFMLVLAFIGCSTPPAGPQVIKVPVAIECRVQIPERPAMPTDALTPASTLDSIVAALMAEIELREGYESLLLVALASCTRPVSQ